ncbi:hypothetical protein DI005_31495 [Prauserella sp. PE36]|uniref:hypothetical protein n=1 Tax=Prauserella sp. PE36 TaxID=1504709 RepID=UPI000DE34EFD|nr:hypothetical protein [Prauserella sp. PE36]RBM12962.1 hypothetical protein DI005_31495 [Prauserella sp. PE36]
MAENRRPWFVVAATATVLGVGGLVAAGTASADVELNDQQVPAQVQLVDHAQQQAGDDSPESADSPAASAVDSPADRADNTADSVNSPNTGSSVNSVDSPN